MSHETYPADRRPRSALHGHIDGLDLRDSQASPAPVRTANLSDSMIPAGTSVLFPLQIPRLLAQQLIDLARGVAAECLKDRHMGETRLLEALHDLRTRCPSARPIPSPEEEEAARTAFRPSGDDRSPRPHPPRRRQS